MENKVAKIPVASHGLHKHDYNYPWLSSINFGDVMPCYINTVRKGERDSPKAGVFSQLMPIAHNAFATGRFNFKAIFVPYKLVWRPWYSFDQETDYNGDGETFRVTAYPYVEHGIIGNAFFNVSNGYVTADGNVDNYDVVEYENDTTFNFYHLTDSGRRIVRILGALGCMPSFIKGDKHTINILPILCYLKAYADYYYPNNYVGNTDYMALSRFFELEGINYSDSAEDLLYALSVASLNFYESSVFDLAWDNPAAPNINATLPQVRVADITNDNTDPAVVANYPAGVGSPSNSGLKPSNGTPFVGGSRSSNNTPAAVVTNYVLEVLKSVTMWAKRRQLSGARLLDRFLVSRGLTLGNDSARISYLVGQRNIEIQVSGVENTTDTNLGELAGRGVASSGNQPLTFDCRPDDDGILLVIVSPLPDASFPVLLDGFACRKDFMDNYHAEYDKLGAAVVPSRIIQSTLDGRTNQYAGGNDASFGFLNQYWDEVQERPRLLGDFILQSRGAEELKAYHTFRLLSPELARHHSYDFVRMQDNGQYQRLFYSARQENLMLFLRWYGVQFKEKLPLGDSYNWDDDELNRKVSVVVGGSQK